MTVSQVNTFTVHKARATRPGALLLARAVLAAAALPLLGAAVRHAACARGRRADVLAAVQCVTYGVAAAAATGFMLITCAPVAAVGQLRDAPTHVQRSNALHVWMSNHAFPPSCCTWCSAAL